MRNMIMRLFVVALCSWCGCEPLAAALTRRRDAAQAYASSFARQYEPYLFAAVPLHGPVPVLQVLSPAPLAARPSAAATNKPYASSVRHTPYTRPYTESRPYSESNTYAESRPYAETRPYTESRPYTETRTYGVSRPYTESRPYGESRPYSEPRPYGESSPYSDLRAYSEVHQYLNPRPYPSRPYVEAGEFEEAGAGSGFGRAPHKPIARPLPTPEYAADLDTYALQVYPSSAPRVTFSKQPSDVSASFEVESQETPTVLYARPSLSGGYTYRKISKKTPPKKVSFASSKEQPVIVKIHKHKIIKS